VKNKEELLGKVSELTKRVWKKVTEIAENVFS